MTDYFTQLLARKCKGEGCMILYSEWLREKEMAIRILSNVSNMSSHFSIHDHTHSEAILKYIKSFLGKKVLEEQFTATDLWMLLFSAYYHDIGMVIRNADIEKIFNDPKEREKFNSLVDDQQNDKAASLYENAKIFKNDKEAPLSLKDSILKWDLLPKLMTIFTEFFRKKHGERSREFVDNLYKPESSLTEMGITSLIPQRLFRALGLICASHNEDDFSKVLAIEEREVGVGEGDAHPRFIACLLRLGDVLDIDNNRFNPTALAYMGEDNLPSDTRYHIRKHLSITHFCVSPEMIDITAEVKVNEGDNDQNKEDSFDVDAYNVAEALINWFKWLREEFEHQKVYINQIVPSGYEIKLPYVKRAECRLVNYLYLEDKKKPRFEIDSAQAFELLQGMNLYTEPWQPIREIVQNSIDATLLHYWTAHNDEVKQKIEDEDQTEWYQRLLSIFKPEDYPIDVRVTDGLKEQPETYCFSIEDKGIGISIEDLQYLLKVGSAKKNKKKQKIIDSMPRWFRPSGAFGIGFQSLFLVTDCVSIVTKNAGDGRQLSVKLFSPNGPHKGDVLIRELETKYEDKPFTRVRFLVKKKLLKKKDNFLERQLTSTVFDVLGDWGPDYDINCILSALAQYVKFSPFPVKFYYGDNDANVKQLPTAGILKEKMHEIKLDAMDYDGKDTQFLQLKYEINRTQNCFSGETQIYFKNQFVCNYEEESYPFVNLKLNFMSGRASRWLTLDRNSIKEDQQHWLRQFFRETLAYELEDERKIDDTQKQSLSLLDYVFLKDIRKNAKDSRKEIPLWIKDQWVNYNISDDKGSPIKTIGEILTEYDSFELLLKHTPDYIHYDNHVLTMSSDCSSDHYNLWIMLVTIFKERMQKLKWSDEKVVFFDKKAYISEIEKLTVNMDKWDECIKNAISQSEEEHALLPCKGKYQVMAIDARNTAKVCRQFLPFDLDSNCNNLMVSPFTDKNKGKNLIVSAAFVDFVYQNLLLKDLKISKEEIKNLYQDFIKEYGQA